MAPPPDLAERLRRRIAEEGPLRVADFMAAANSEYYASRDPLGAAGDFTTAPEISQMFGELVGLWLADLWLRAGKPDAHYVELGPGRGTLAADALRAMGQAGLTPPVHFVETSPVLRAAQAERVPAAKWHEGLESLPADAPLLVVANEFFDALPIRQFAPDGRELRVDWKEGRFVRDGAAVREDSPAARAVAEQLGRRLAEQGGAALIVDYGHIGGRGDTLQSVARHAFADPFEAPGTRDLTAHVDFGGLAAAARGAGAPPFGPVDQGTLLERLGIGLRAAALARAAPERAAAVEAARLRLTAPDGMGNLFKALALVHPGWPAPAGF